MCKASPVLPGGRMTGLWTEILTDFDPDEETANFGTRVSLVTEGSLYEVTRQTSAVSPM